MGHLRLKDYQNTAVGEVLVNLGKARKRWHGEARRIPGNDRLNSLHYLLPFFDVKSVETVADDEIATVRNGVLRVRGPEPDVRSERPGQVTQGNEHGARGPRPRQAKSFDPTSSSSRSKRMAASSRISWTPKVPSSATRCRSFRAWPVTPGRTRR
jgi:hypothetical protein